MKVVISCARLEPKRLTLEGTDFRGRYEASAQRQKVYEPWDLQAAIRLFREEAESRRGLPAEVANADAVLRELSDLLGHHPDHRGEVHFRGPRHSLVDPSAYAAAGGYRVEVRLARVESSRPRHLSIAALFGWPPFFREYLAVRLEPEPEFLAPAVWRFTRRAIRRLGPQRLIRESLDHLADNFRWDFRFHWAVHRGQASYASPRNLWSRSDLPWVEIIWKNGEAAARLLEPMLASYAQRRPAPSDPLEIAL